MSQEQMKEAFRTVIQAAYGAGKLEVLDDLFASDFVEHQADITPPTLEGVQAMRLLAYRSDEIRRLQSWDRVGTRARPCWTTSVSSPAGDAWTWDVGRWDPPSSQPPCGRCGTGGAADINPKQLDAARELTQRD